MSIISLYHWFSSSSNKPDPAQQQTKEKELEVVNANTRVLEAMESQQRRKRPRSTYAYYSPESGNKAAVEKFSKDLAKPVSESTVWGFTTKL